MTALYRGETVRIVSWHKSGTKAKIATSRGVRWAQAAELELLTLQQNHSPSAICLARGRANTCYRRTIAAYNAPAAARSWRSSVPARARPCRCRSKQPRSATA